MKFTTCPFTEQTLDSSEASISNLKILMFSIEVYHKYTFLCDSLITEIFKASLQNHFAKY